MDSALYANYLAILKHELVPALGCTEPIAIAYAAAKARQILGDFPDAIEMQLSGNIIKNVKGVTVPNSGGMKGIDAAAVLGIVGGNADKALEVLEESAQNLLKKQKNLLHVTSAPAPLQKEFPTFILQQRLQKGSIMQKSLLLTSIQTLPGSSKTEKFFFPANPRKKKQKLI